MDLFDSVLSGFEVALAPRNILWVFVGALVGMVIGVLPGIGPVPTITLLLPITYSLPPDSAVILLAGVYYGAMYGGTITSVLLKVPGEAASVVTVIDGYQMARRGRAGSALGIAAIGSFIGGTVAILGLTFGAPVLARNALSFGPPEYTVLALLGILMVATLTTGSTLKAVVAAGAGLLLATVGLDQFVGAERFTGGVLELADGLDFVALAMGLFGLGEIFYALDHRARQTFTALPFNNVWPSRSDIRESRWSILRGSLLGFGLGVLPGGSGTLSGVAGPETANNAAATASFIPLLTLGIPTNAVMAVILGALMLQGVAPGPNLINEKPEVFWGVIDSMYLGNVLLLIMSIPLVGLFVKLVAVRESILAPVVVAVVMLGTYTIANTVFDMWIVIAFGILGYLMRKTGFDPGPLLLAFVLGAILENSFRQSLRMFSGDIFGFVERPISGTLFALIALVIAAPIVMRLLRPGRPASLTEVLQPALPSDTAQPALPPDTAQPARPPAQTGGSDPAPAKAVKDETDS
jgi:putative tricarboxylic transport membrane protein